MKIKTLTRLMGLILAGSLMLVGCGDDEPPPPTPTVVLPAATATDAPAPTEAPAAADTPMPTEEPTAAPEPVVEAQTATDDQPETTSDNAYPAPADAYPAPVTDGSVPVTTTAAGEQAAAYPAPTVSNLFAADEKKFAINQPVRAGEKTVTGAGPRGVEIQIVDVTLMAEPIGSTTIDDNGEYSIDLSQALQADHQIGIQVLGVPDGVSDNEYLNALVQFAGQGAQDNPIPSIGILWDSTTVLP
jgi:hypothetical protein